MPSGQGGSTAGEQEVKETFFFFLLYTLYLLDFELYGCVTY